MPEDTVPSMVHNGYLQLAVTTGVPGLLLYLALVGGVVRIAWRASSAVSSGVTDADATLAAGIAGALAGFLVQDLSGWPEISSSAFFWTLAGAAVSLHPTAPAVRTPGLFRVHRRVASGVVGAMSLFFGGLAFGTVRELRADRSLHTAQRLGAAGDWSGAVSQMNAGLELAPNDAGYLDEAAVLYLDRLKGSGDAATYREGASLVERAHARNPFDPYSLIHRIDLDTAALREKIIGTPSRDALTAVTAALAMDTNNSSVHESVARFRLASGNPLEALKAIETARALRPTHVGYRVTEGDIFWALGNRSRSIEAYRSELSLHPSPDMGWLAAERKLVAALVATADYQSAVAEGLAFLKRQPGDATGHVLLGVAHLGRNDAEAAKSAFAAALAIDPGNVAARQGRTAAEHALRLKQ